MEDVDEATPRGIIRGVLTTGSISQSARASRPKKTPRTSNTKKTLTNTPSHSEVASRLLTRSRSATSKRKTAPGTTPSDSTTPRTLIAGFLQTAPVAKSVVKGKRQKTAERETRRTSNLTSQAEDNTPRTIIQNFLREALTETPVEPVLSDVEDEDIHVSEQSGEEEKSLSLAASVVLDDGRTEADRQSVAKTTVEPVLSDVEDEDIFEQSGEEENRSSLAASVVLDDGRTEADGQSVATTTSHHADHVALVEAATPMLLDSSEESDSTAELVGSQEKEQEIDTLPSMGRESLQTATASSRNKTRTSRQWRELVTPQLPLNVSSPGNEQLEQSRNVTERSVGERPFFGGKPPTGKDSTKISKRPSGPRMPSALVKSIFQHFSQAKVSKEALEAVEHGSNLFFKQVSSDLMAYCQHAHRSTIELADVELLMKRQGFITENQSLYSLVEKYLPLEYRQEIIPTVQAGNKIVLK